MVIGVFTIRSLGKMSEIYDLMEQTKIDKCFGLLLSIAFRKSFASLECPIIIQKALETYNLAEDVGIGSKFCSIMTFLSEENLSSPKNGFPD